MCCVRNLLCTTDSYVSGFMSVRAYIKHVMALFSVLSLWDCELMKALLPGLLPALSYVATAGGVLDTHTGGPI